MEGTRPRVLLLAGKASGSAPVAEALGALYEVDVVESTERAMDALRQHDYHAVFSDVGDFLPLERGLEGEKTALALNTIGEGVCVVDADGRMIFSNKRMRGFSPEVTEQVKKICCQGCHMFAVQGAESTARTKKFTFQQQDRYFEHADC